MAPFGQIGGQESQRQAEQKPPPTVRPLPICAAKAANRGALNVHMPGTAGRGKPAKKFDKLPNRSPHEASRRNLILGVVQIEATQAHIHTCTAKLICNTPTQSATIYKTYNKEGTRSHDMSRLLPPRRPNFEAAAPAVDWQVSSERTSCEGNAHDVALCVGVLHNSVAAWWANKFQRGLPLS